MKVYTVIKPVNVKKHTEDYLLSIMKVLSQRGYHVRHNGINGKESKLLNIENNLCYLPSKEYLGLENKLPTPKKEVVTWATEIAQEYYKNFNSLSELDKHRVMRNIYILKGYNTTETEFVLYIPLDETKQSHHSLEYIDFIFPMKLANILGINTVALNQFRLSESGVTNHE